MLLSLRRRGQLLLLTCALLGAVAGTSLAMMVEYAQTPSAFAVPPRSAGQLGWQRARLRGLRRPHRGTEPTAGPLGRAPAWQIVPAATPRPATASTTGEGPLTVARASPTRSNLDTCRSERASTAALLMGSWVQLRCAAPTVRCGPDVQRRWDQVRCRVSTATATLCLHGARLSPSRHVHDQLSPLPVERSSTC
jgi:hypothetical protein